MLLLDAIYFMICGAVLAVFALGLLIEVTNLRNPERTTRDTLVALLDMAACLVAISSVVVTLFQYAQATDNMTSSLYTIACLIAITIFTFLFLHGINYFKEPRQHTLGVGALFSIAVSVPAIWALFTALLIRDEIVNDWQERLNNLLF